MYVMVTTWENHWESLPKLETYYPRRYIHLPGDPQEGTRTIFVKVNKNGDLEKAWQGKVTKIKAEGDKVFFEYSLEREVSEMPAPLCQLKPGWYEVPDLSAPSEDERIFEPAFFVELLETQSPERFEYLVSALLRLIGIPVVWRFVQERQAGRADGFFRISGLAVLYDVTLQSKFLEKKEQQLRNYCQQMSESNIVISSKVHEPLETSIQRRVWVITRGSSRHLLTKGSVVVQEISVRDLIRLYFDRLRLELNEDGIAERLRALGGST